MQQLGLLLLLLLPAGCASLGAVAELPHFSAQEGGHRTAELEKEGKWWAHVGDHVYHAPPASSGLSERVGDYYYAFGSDAALSDELRSRRVGGQGRLHIFHLPEGPSMLQLDTLKGSRRSALSALKQLRESMQLSQSFPPYQKSGSYRNPLDAGARKLESDAVSRLTPEGLMANLQEITSFDTRSFGNPDASSRVQAFLKNKFTEMGYTVCENSFFTGGPATNIVAYVPGTSGTNEVVVLGAHYDDIPAHGNAPGAEDNGSGVAALLGIMQAFKDAGLKPKKSITFVAFAGEEPGLLGSAAYADAILSRRSNMESCLPAASEVPSFLGKAKRLGRSRKAYSAIIMDEVGWVSPALPSETVNLESYDWTKEVMEHLAQSSKDHNGDSLTVVHSDNPFGSDHMSFLEMGIPAVLTINGDDEAYPFYHTSGDEITQVTGSLVAKIAKMNFGGLLRLAGLDTAAPASG